MVNPPYSPLIAHVFTVPYGGRGRRAPMSLTLENSPGSGHLRNFPAPTLMVGLHNTRLEGGKYLSLNMIQNQINFFLKQKTFNIVYCLLGLLRFYFFCHPLSLVDFLSTTPADYSRRFFPPWFLSPPLKKAEVM